MKKLTQKKSDERRMNTVRTSRVVQGYLYTILSLFLSGMRSFFYAVVDIAWAIAVFFLIAALISYYKADTTVVQPFFTLISFVQHNWAFFFIALLFYHWFVFSNELFKSMDLKDEQSNKFMGGKTKW
jgi:hypothetical protein